MPSNVTAKIYSVLVSQNNADVIPFWFISESGFETATQIDFVIESSNSINYDIILNPTFTQNMIAPERENAKYRHDAFATVDVIVDDPNGIKDISVRNQKQIYQYEEPENTYFVPKFSWSNNGSVSTGNALDINIFLGTSDKTLSLKNYSNNASNSVSIVSNIYSMNTTSEVCKILVNKNRGELYLSEYDTLAKITSNKYIDVVNTYSIVQTNEILNTNDDLMSYSNGNIIVSTEAYNGNVVIRNISDFSIISQYSGFDSPFKVIRSMYHNCFFVAGTNKVWKLMDNGTKKSIYEVKDFNILDIDCSETGELCIILSNNSYSILRILNRNLYSFIINEQYDNLRFCKYCGKGLFYILGELSNVNSYQTINYMANINEKSVNSYLSNANVISLITPTPFPTPTEKFELYFPIGGEVFQKGTTQVIEWGSTQSISDPVSLELYKGGNLFDTLSNSVSNSGEYDWTISNVYPDGADYQIKGTWLSAGTNSSNSDISGYFSILTQIQSNTSVTATNVLAKSIGIDFSAYNNTIVSVSSNGLLTIFDVNNSASVGIFDTGVKNVLSMAIQDSNIPIAITNEKARVFVGSQPYLSDMWDSGAVDTNLNYMYYGGGNNLAPGNKYYLNLQTYTSEHGWSEVQTKSFIMPN